MIAKNVKYKDEKCPNLNLHKTNFSHHYNANFDIYGCMFHARCYKHVFLLLRALQRNMHILTLVDNFTQHVQTYALIDRQSVTLASVFVNKFSLRFE